MRVLLIILLCSTIRFLNAQTWKKGFVITKDGARINGLIKKNWRECYGPGNGPVFFKMSPPGQVRLFMPRDLTEFGFGTYDIYFSTPVHRTSLLLRSVSLRSIRLASCCGHRIAMTYDRGKPFSYDTLFLHVIHLTRELALYESFDGMPRYYWAYRSGSMSPYPFTYEKIGEVEGAVCYVKGFRQELENLMEPFTGMSEGGRATVLDKICQCEYNVYDLADVFKWIGVYAHQREIYYHSHGLFGVIPFTRIASIKGRIVDAQ